MKQEEVKLLELDYEKTLAFIDKIDGFMLQIKHWAILTCSAIIAFGVVNKSIVILIMNYFVCFAFCFLELLYKSFHENCIEKSFHLEGLLRKSLSQSSILSDSYIFGIGHCIQPIHFKHMMTILFHGERWHFRAVYWLILLATTAAVVVIHFMGLK